jgi:hypothetical protein
MLALVFSAPFISRLGYRMKKGKTE